MVANPYSIARSLLNLISNAQPKKQNKRKNFRRQAPTKSLVKTKFVKRTRNKSGAPLPLARSSGLHTVSRRPARPIRGR